MVRDVLPWSCSKIIWREGGGVSRRDGGQLDVLHVGTMTASTDYGGVNVMCFAHQASLSGLKRGLEEVMDV